MHRANPVPRFALAVACTLALGLGGCGPSATPTAAGPAMPKLVGDRLEAGRAIWLGTCRACHLLGIAGAPAVTNFAEWDPRLAKGKEALYQSALNGIKGPDGKYRMPPRGGNPRLSDEQVRLAVDYKAAAIQALYAATRKPAE
jgi:cytochrome c5